MTIIALWPKRSDLAFMNLMGKPVWMRTLEATRGLRPHRTVWVGKSAPGGLDSLSSRGLRALRDTVLFLPAELACVQPSTLRRLLKASLKAPSGLFRRDGGSPVALAATPAALKTPTVGTWNDLIRRLRPVPVFAGDDNDLLVVDSVEAWSRAHRVLRQRKVRSLLGRGVLVPDPESVYVDPEVSVSAGTVLAPWVLLEGSCRVGKNCLIGSFSHLVSSSVGAGTKILDHCFIRDSRIGKAASIGPFAHLRPESMVGDQARVGNYVELKKARLGAGAKAPHLSYVGDATIGRGANLGAGTITCNYDGTVKNRTIVGDGAFIGSDVQLVAPVRIGKGAFVAAGSCIVSDVPAHALAVARSRQIVKKNWAKRRKKAR